MITYFVHSTSTDNEKQLCSGWNDPELSVTGKEQALRLQKKLHSKNFDVVYCSDLKRAKETARIAFPNTRIITVPSLREMNYGDLNGRHISHFPLNDRTCIETRFINGENCQDVEKRLNIFLHKIKSKNVNIAIVAHKYPQFALDVICNNVSWEEAISNDWRRNGKWQPGWGYTLPDNFL